MTEAAPTPPNIGWKKGVLYTLLPVLLFFAALEGAARVFELWRPPLPVDLGQGFDENSRLFVPKAGNPLVFQTNPRKAVSFNHQEFRRRKPADTLRVFVLGGSSVKYLDYELPLLEDRLEEALPRYAQVEIINCGGLSYGSHRLVLIAAEVLSYAPDLVLVYSGHNEFEELEQLDLAGLDLLPVQRLLDHSALYRLLRDRIASHRIAGLEQDRARRDVVDSIPDASKAWRHEFSEEEVAERMAAYRANLTKIIEMCRERGVPVIIGTVPSNLVKPALPGEAGEAYEAVLELFARERFEEGRALAQRILAGAIRHQASDKENAIIRDLAREYDIPLADVEAAVTAAEPNHIPGETLFNDHCHLNPTGNKILARVYEQRILEVLR